MPEPNVLISGSADNETRHYDLRGRWSTHERVLILIDINLCKSGKVFCKNVLYLPFLLVQLPRALCRFGLLD